MGGIFGFFDYTKHGPGVAKDGPKKARIIVFFEIYFRKFWNLIKLNMLFLLFNLPSVFIAAFIAAFFIPDSIDGTTSSYLLTLIAALLLCIPIITIGPAQAGFTYVLRNYAREEHAFIWSDFKEHALKNLKESIIISLIDMGIVTMVAFDLYVYFHIAKGNAWITFATGFLLVSVVFYLMMHLYIYPMLVTFKLSVKQVYKNAFLFALIRFIPNLLMLLLCVAIICLTFLLFTIGVFLAVFITFSTIGLIINFYAYPTLKKYMIDRIESRESMVPGSNKANE
ncbi:MAG: DUF624 domain-containing protein [Clostridia bacterium]|nr:DUF624 domain-containing protein [Clostridia bacterium]